MINLLTFLSTGTCISKYHINFQSVAPRKIEIRGTVDAFAIQDEEVEMCVRDERTLSSNFHC